MTGGSFSERLQLAGQWQHADSNRSIPYLYCDEDPEHHLATALSLGYSVAIDPHMFKPIQTVAEAERLIEKYRPQQIAIQGYSTLTLMPDTAHSYIAGDDIFATLRKHLDKINCVHIKDWTPEYGRSYQFYARGFVPLGKGDVELEKVLDFLRPTYSKWIIVEVGHPNNPVEAAEISRQYLREKFI